MSGPAPLPPAGVVSLVGARGSGKSTVGRLLADRLGLPFVDADAELERANGRRIRDIFAEDGEPVFRALEVATLAGLLAGGPRVLATGGGAVLNPDTRRRLRGAGPVVYLRADPAALHARTAGDPDRPPLTDLPPEDEVRAVLAERDPLYRRTATLVIDAAPDPETVAGAVLAALNPDATAGRP